MCSVVELSVVVEVEVAEFIVVQYSIGLEGRSNHKAVQ